MHENPPTQTETETETETQAQDTARISTIISTLKTSQDYIWDFQETCETLLEHAENSPPTPAAYAEAIPLIVSALKKWEKSSRLCTLGTNALCKIAGTDGHMWRLAATADGFPTYVAILKRHTTSSSLCKYACIGLASMLTAPHPDLLTPNFHDVDRVTTVDGITTLISVIYHHTDFNNIDVVVNACEALGHIASLSGLKCVEAKIIPMLLELVSDKNDSVPLMGRVSYILFRITQTCYLTEKDSNAVIPALIAIMNYHTDSVEICKKSISALANIVSWDPVYVKVALEHEALPTLLDVQESLNLGTLPALNRVLHSIATKDYEPHPHVLQPQELFQGRCDICEAEPGQFMGCRICNYDECFLCFDAQQK